VGGRTPTDTGRALLEPQLDGVFRGRMAAHDRKLVDTFIGRRALHGPMTEGLAATVAALQRGQAAALLLNRPPGSSLRLWARVVAVASGAHEMFLRELGADEFIDYTKERPEEVVRDVDLVFDTVGGPDSRRFLRTLKRGGSLYPVYFGQFDDEENAELGVTVTAVTVRSSGAQLAELQSLVDAGRIRVAIDSTFPLADARAAHERVARGHIRGKIVLTVV
ncbi:zinc-binding dehydrogenase, partial [Streptomyces viridiviolaceus]